MKQFVSNSSFNSNQKISVSSTGNATRLLISPSALSTSYSQREALFVNVNEIGQPRFIPCISTTKAPSPIAANKQLTLKTALNSVIKSSVYDSKTFQRKSLPARRKRLRALARSHSIPKTEVFSGNSFFVLHQSNFFDKAGNKLSIFSRNNNSRITKKAHVPLLLNPGQVDGVTKTQRFGSSWENGLTASHTHTSFSSVLSLLAGTQVNFIILPALALARYAFDFEAVRSAIVANQSLASSALPIAIPLNSARFLRHLEQERSGRFQYVAIQIPDLLRVSFACRYFKKPAVLANLFAQTLSSLPRNRKETQFLRFLIKVVKVFSAQRTERLGVRLRFKGRVNRWRRTKHIIGEKGRLPLYTYSARLERGEAQAITRKGTLGIRIWLAYHPSFARSFRRTLLSFIRVRSTDSTNLFTNVSTYTSPFS